MRRIRCLLALPSEGFNYDPATSKHSAPRHHNVPVYRTNNQIHRAPLLQQKEKPNNVNIHEYSYI